MSWRTYGARPSVCLLNCMFIRQVSGGLFRKFMPGDRVALSSVPYNAKPENDEEQMLGNNAVGTPQADYSEPIEALVMKVTQSSAFREERKTMELSTRRPDDAWHNYDLLFSLSFFYFFSFFIFFALHQAHGCSLIYFLFLLLQSLLKVVDRTAHMLQLTTGASYPPGVMLNKPKDAASSDKEVEPRRLTWRVRVPFSTCPSSFSSLRFFCPSHPAHVSCAHERFNSCSVSRTH